MSRLGTPARIASGVCCSALLIVAGCGGGDGSETTTRTSITLMMTPSAPEVWRATMGTTADGLRQRLRAEVVVRPVPNPEDVQNALLACGQRERDLVVCLGAECGTAVFTVAPIYPTTHFLVIPGVRHERNVAAATFDTDEAAYVAGAAFSALGRALEIEVLNRAACPEGFITALEAGVRSRGVEPLLRPPDFEAPPEDPGPPDEEVEEEAETPDPPLLVLCCGQGAAIDRTVAEEATVTLALDACLSQELPGRTVATVEVDLEEAIARIADELLGRAEPGRAFAFDLGSGVVALRITEPEGAPLPPEVRRELAAARDEVVAGIAEIESLGI